MSDSTAPPTRPTGVAPRLPWRRLLAGSLLGTLCAVALVLPANLRSRQGVVLLIAPGARSAAAPVLHRDFPGLPLPGDVGHDGQSFYAIAREPMHLTDAARSLDRPAYREQRILFPLLAWMLHPGGGGRGLVIAMVLIGIAALFAGGIALGALSTTLGGSAWLSVAFALLPGARSSLNLGVPDALALAFALGALTLDLRKRPQLALLLATAAVLTKESLLLVLVGYALARRDRPSARLVALPALAAGAWWCCVRLVVGHRGTGIHEFDPLHGLWASVQGWRHGLSPQPAWAGLAVVTMLGCYALRRGALRTPIGWAIAIQLAFLLCLSSNVLFIDDNANRAELPCFALALVAVFMRGREAAAAPPADVRRPRAVPVSAR